MAKSFEIKDPSRYRYVGVGGIRERKKHIFADMYNQDEFKEALSKFREPAVSLQRYLVRPDDGKDKDKIEHIVDFCFDFDDKEKPDLSGARMEAIRMLKYLKEEMGLSDNDCILYFTGARGFNILIPAEVIGGGLKSEDLRKVAAYLSKKLSLTCMDMSMYSRYHLIRYPNTKNLRNQREKKKEPCLYKIPIKEEELCFSPISEIRKMARKPRSLPEKKSEFKYNPEFRKKLNDLLAHVKSLEKITPAQKRKKQKMQPPTREKISPEKVPDTAYREFETASKHCAFLHYLVEEPEKVTYDQWIFGILCLYQLKGGRELLHYISSLDPERYYKDGRDVLEYSIDFALRKSYRPASCARIKKHFKGCPSSCKAYSPFEFFPSHPSSKAPRLLCKNRHFKKPEDSLDRDEAREKLREILEETKRKDDKKVHLVKVEPGVGKTQAAVEVFADRTFCWLAPMHDVNLEQAISYRKEAPGGKNLTYAKFPKPGTKNCKYFEIMKIHLAANINYRIGLCSKICGKMKKCRYLSGLRKARRADQVFVPDYYLMVDGFFTRDEIAKKDFIIIDEDPIIRLCHPASLSKDSLERFFRIFKKFKEEESLSFPQKNASRIVLELTEKILYDMNTPYSKGKKHVLGLLDPGIIKKPLAEISCDFEGLDIAFTKYLAEKKFFEFKNYLSYIYYLLNQKEKVPFLLYYHERSGELSFHFNLRHSLPEGKTIIILSATARKEVYEKITEREVVLHELPQISHTSGIYQIMNGNYPREELVRRFPELQKRIEKIRDVEGFEKNRTTIILPKKVRKIYKDLLKGYTCHHFQGLRGSTKFEQFELHFIVGSPKVPEENYIMLGIALNDKRPFTQEEMQLRREKILLEKEDVWMINAYRFSHPALNLAYNVYVTDELMQAVGRSRYVDGFKVVYIVTNEPLDLLGVKRILFKDVIKKKKQKRRKIKEDRIRLLITKVKRLTPKIIVERGICKDEKQARKYLRSVAEEDGWEEIDGGYECHDPKKMKSYNNLRASGIYLPEESGFIPPSGQMPGNYPPGDDYQGPPPREVKFGTA